MIQAYVSERFLGDALDVFIVNAGDGYRRVLRSKPGGVYEWVDLERANVLYSVPEEPTITLPRDSGRALLEALVRHYHGAEDTRQLRKDYDAERNRVDEQNKVIADIVRILVESVS